MGSTDHLTTFVRMKMAQIGEAASQSHSSKWQGWDVKRSPYIQEVVGFLWRENLGHFAARQPSNLGWGCGTPGYTSSNPIKAT